MSPPRRRVIAAAHVAGAGVCAPRRFDPSSLHFMVMDEIALAPEAAAVGLEIRVVGNDSGEVSRDERELIVNPRLRA